MGLSEARELRVGGESSESEFPSPALPDRCALVEDGALRVSAAIAAETENGSFTLSGGSSGSASASVESLMVKGAAS
jgi:hypothetical protein